MKKLCFAMLALVFLCAGAHAQQAFTPYPTQTVRFETPPPLLPTNVRANYSGAFGANTFVYWVIAQHTRGASGLSVPATIRNVGTLAGDNAVIISWSAVAGANTYDIIRFTSTAIVLPCAACRVATGVTGTSTSDTGAALGAQALAPAPLAEAVYRLDNSSFAAAQMVWELPPTGATFFPVVASTTGGSGADQDIPCYSGVGTTFAPCDTGDFFWAPAPFLLNFPATGGITGPAATSADDGFVRMPNAIQVCWEAAPAGTDICIEVDASEIFQISGATTVTGALTVAGNIDVSVAGSLTYFDSVNVASVAGTMVLPAGNLFHITGMNAITAMDTCDATNDGRQVKLIFDAVLTFTDGNNLLLDGDFVTAASDSIKLTCDGTNWNEDGRSQNST